MKSITNFITTTITGGILFLLPVTLLYIILHKAYDILGNIAQPLIEGAPAEIFGISGVRIVVLLLILILCFFSGLLFRLTVTKNWIKKLEDNFICYLPGYTLMKSIAADATNQKVDIKMDSVLIKDGDMYIMGFMTEENDDYCTVFLPGSPQHDSGEVKLVPAGLVTKINLPMNKAIKSIKAFGVGISQYLPDTNR